MKRSFVALLAALVTAAWGAGTAAAEDPSAELADQAATSGQAADAASGATQSQPSNLNIAVRVLSPGDDGDVTQSNTVSSDASAGNLNATGQSASQTQTGSGIQTAGQDASSAQLAGALSSAEQSGASNTNIPVRVLSPGSAGDVTQTNAVESDATAGNANLTKQDSDQNQTGGSCPCPTTGGIQTADQSSSNEQAALAKSAAEQQGAKNANISVRVLSPGKGGDVTQSNTVSSSATAINLNATKQTVDQDQSGGSAKCGCSSGPSVQTAKQDAGSEQKAAALSSAKQVGASNTNMPVRVLSPGDDGDVSQSNSVSSSATAANLNLTKQDADQTQGGDRDKWCGCSSGTDIQTAKQDAGSHQAALAESAAIQLPGKDRCGCPTGGNTNTPVRVKSPGDGGDVTQSNDVESTATAANLKATKQDADQTQTSGSGLAIQTSDQSAWSSQGALAGSLAVQQGASNTNTPVRVKSPGGDGDVTQSNSVSSSATAANLNLTKQDADQTHGGREKCGCASGPAIQVIGQDAKSAQGALAKSAALQLGASNINRPVRVYSRGGDGDVSQSNTASSAAGALNANLTGQSGTQTQAGGGIAIQALGQKATSHQLAGAASAAFQIGASNSNAPVRVHSPGGDGAVSQSNTASSAALGANINLTKQDAWQTQRGRESHCGCTPGIAIQALGQSAESKQGAFAHSLALQAGRGKCGCPSGSNNTNDPVGLGSKGGGGSVTQSNRVASAAKALNLNATQQTAGQTQAGGGIAIQALGQAAGSFQLSAAASLAAQLASAPGRRAD